MYKIFWENRFVTYLNTCYSLEYADSVEELKIIIEKIRNWKKEFRPNTIFIFKDAHPICYDLEVKNEFSRSSMEMDKNPQVT